MRYNNIEKTINYDEIDNSANFFVSKYPLVYIKVLLDKKVKYYYFRKNLLSTTIKINNNGR